MSPNGRLVILVDNEALSGFMNEWGLSIYVELPDVRILFDADTDPNVLKYNAEKLNIDLQSIDFAILSHNHRDHYGGYEYVGRICPGLKVYVPPDARSTVERYNLSPYVIERSQRITDNVFIVGPFETAYGFYEIALGVIVKGKGVVVLVGCSHPGIDRIATTVKEFTKERIYYVLGGFHSPSYRSLDVLAGIAQYISPIHCSGDEAKKYVKSKYSNKYRDVRAGSIIPL